MQIVRKSSLTPVPWKNGGGITHEIFRVDAGADFRWRLSVAQIDRSGPFSEFANHRRTMVLLQGTGLRLDFAGGPSRTLTHVGDVVDFDGAIATDCELIDGACTDLNLMVSKSLSIADAWVQSLGEPYAWPPHTGTRVLFVIAGSIEIAGGIALENAIDELVTLERWDSVVLSNPGAYDLRAMGPMALAFLATLDDNPS